MLEQGLRLRIAAKSTGLDDVRMRDCEIPLFEFAQVKPSAPPIPDKQSGQRESCPGLLQVCQDSHPQVPQDPELNVGSSIMLQA